MTKVIGIKDKSFSGELNIRRFTLSIPIFIVIGIALFANCGRVKNHSEGMRGEAFKQAKLVILKNTAPGTIIWIKGYSEYVKSGEYWINYLFEPLSEPGDAGELLLCKSKTWNHYWLGHDVPDSEIPSYIIYDKRKFITDYQYIGDETAEINEKTDDVIIDKHEYLGYSKWSLNLMKNEILARRGKIFKDGNIKRYFKTRKWYRESEDGKIKTLTSVEKTNMEIIQQLIKNKSAAER